MTLCSLFMLKMTTKTNEQPSIAPWWMDWSRCLTVCRLTWRCAQLVRRSSRLVGSGVRSSTVPKTSDDDAGD